MKKILLIILLLFVISEYLYAQADKIIIKLDRKTEAIKENNTIGLNEFKSKLNFSIPKEVANQKYYTIKYIILGVDTLYMIVGLDKQDNRVLYIDKNFNKNFKDEERIIFPNSLSNQSDFESPVYTVKARDNSYSFSFLPFMQFFETNDSNDYKTQYTVLIKEKFYGHFNINNTSYHLDFYPASFRKASKNGFFYFDYKKDSSESATANNEKDYGSKIYLDDSLMYKISYLSPFKDTVILSFISIEKDSASIGNTIANLKSVLYEKDSLVNLHDFIQGYVLIDFWGMWCNPCLAFHPTLRKYVDKYAELNLKLISIAMLSDDKELKSTIEFIKAHNSNHNTYNFIDKLNDKSANSIENKLRVNSFPYTILINKDKKILMTAIGEKQFKEKILPILEKIKQKE